MERELKECPVCHTKHKLINRHIVNTNDQEHNDFYNLQKELILAKFDDLSFYNDEHRQNTNIFFPYKLCNQFWLEKFGKDKCKDRQQKIAALVRNQNKKKYICKYCNEEVTNISYHIKKLHPEKLQEQVDYIMPLFFDLTFTREKARLDTNIYFSYKEISEYWANKYGSELEQQRKFLILAEKSTKNISICPVCGQEVHSLYAHICIHCVDNPSLIDQQHIDFFHNQEQLILANFKNDNISSDEKTKEYGIFFTYDQCKEIWKEHFSDEEIEKRGKKVALNALNNVSLDDTQVESHIPNKIECPVCKQVVSKPLLQQHFLKNSKDEEHKKFYDNYIKYTILPLIDNLYYDVNSAKDFNLLFGYRTVFKIWEQYYGKYSDRNSKTYLRTKKLNAFYSGNTQKLLIREGKLHLWQEGQTKETNPTIAKMAREKSLKMSAGKVVARRGLAGFRPKVGIYCLNKLNDEGLYCNSTYEANVYRILDYNKSHYKTEINMIIKDSDNNEYGYRVDLLDIDNFFGFGKDVYIEIKGFMDEKSWNKICMFRKTYGNDKLIVLSNDIPNKYKLFDYTVDVDYNKLILKYKDKINFETKKDNIKTNTEKWL